MNRIKPIHAALLGIALLYTSINAAADTIDFRDNGNITTAALTEGIVTVTGSGPVWTSLQGLGIEGVGSSVLTLEPGETMTFSFATPVADVALIDILPTDIGNDGAALNATLESFDASGTSTALVVTPLDTFSAIQVSQILGVASMSSFRITMNNDAIRVGGISFTDIADPLSVAYDFTASNFSNRVDDTAPPFDTISGSFGVTIEPNTGNTGTVEMTADFIDLSILGFDYTVDNTGFTFEDGDINAVLLGGLISGVNGSAPFTNDFWVIVFVDDLGDIVAPGVFANMHVRVEGQADFWQSLPADFSITKRPTGTTPGAEPPTAEAGPNLLIHAGQQVTLNGNGSFDDLTPTEDLIFVWSFVSVPPGSVLTALNDATTITPNFTADLPGDYVVSLVVTDQNGLSSVPDTAIVSSLNVPPIADAGADQGAIVGDFLTLDGSASSDPDFDPITYSWTLTGLPPGSAASLTLPNNALSHLVPDLPGIYTAELVVNDGFANSAPDEITITIVTAEAFAEVKAVDAINAIGTLPIESVSTKGNQNAISQHLSQVVSALQIGDIDEATFKLIEVIERTDGCTLRGAPDAGNGPGPQPKKDYVTDCAEQEAIYLLLTEALEALTPFDTVTISFPDEHFDLETGVVCNDNFEFCQDPFDFYFAFNGRRTNPAVLFQTQVCQDFSLAEIAFLDMVPFGQVSESDIDVLEFTTALIDEPFDTDDTVVLKTCAGNFFKIGNTECKIPNPDFHPDCQQSDNTAPLTVKFDYQLLRGAQ